MKFFRRRKRLIKAENPDNHSVNYHYALFCIEDKDVRAQIEEAVAGMLWKQTETAVAMFTDIDQHTLVKGSPIVIKDGALYQYHD